MEELQEGLAGIEDLNSLDALVELTLKCVHGESDCSRRQWVIQVTQVGNWHPNRVDLHGFRVLVLCEYKVFSQIDSLDEYHDLIYPKVYQLVQQREIGVCR
jgi:hypothetical protein